MERDDQLHKPRTSRASRKLPDLKGVCMYLTNKEREQLNQLAFAEYRSISSMARIIFLRGLQLDNAIN